MDFGSLSMIPFGITGTPLKPLFHLCGFLEEGSPTLIGGNNAD